MPVKEHSGDMVLTHSAISLQGGKMLAKAWLEYPEYFIGFCLIGLISASAGCICIYLCSKKRDELECLKEEL